MNKEDIKNKALSVKKLVTTFILKLNLESFVMVEKSIICHLLTRPATSLSSTASLLLFTSSGSPAVLHVSVLQSAMPQYPIHDLLTTD